MFHSILLHPISFKSNPELDPRPQNDWHTREDGSPVNRFIMAPRDNKSFFHGAHYDPSRDSLRARLNLGIPLQKVSIGITENDPNKLSATARSYVNAINSRASHRKAVKSDTVQSVESSQSSKTI